MTADRWTRRVLKPLTFVAGLIPATLLAWGALTGGLSADPVQDITNTTGIWTLRFVLITLTVTPLRKVTGWNRIIRFRRMLGLFAFFYGTLHLLTFVVLDYFFAFDLMLKRVGEEKFITAGLTGFVLMLPLAATSTQGMIRRLGGRWRALHRLVYASATAGVVHYTWLTKIDVRRPLIYGMVLAVLLGFRLWHRIHRRLEPALTRGARGGTANDPGVFSDG